MASGNNGSGSVATLEQSQHDLLLIVTVGIIILFITGLAAPARVSVEPSIFGG